MLRELTCYESSRCSGAVGSTNCTLADMCVTFNSSTAYSFKLCGTAYRGILESRESCDDSCCSIGSSSGCWLYGDVMVPYHMALELLPSAEERWRMVRGAYYGHYLDSEEGKITYDSPLYKVCDYQCVPQSLVPNATASPSPVFTNSACDAHYHYKIIQVAEFMVAI